MRKSKLLLLPLAVMLILSVLLVGCGRRNENTDSNSQRPTSSEQNSSILAPDDNGTSSDNNGTSSDNGMQNDANNGGFSLRESIDNVYHDVMNGVDDWLDPIDEETMTTAYDMDFSNFDEYYGRVPKANVHATSVIGVKVKAGKKEEARAELMKFQAAMEKNFERYLPDQYDLVKDYRIIENGDYMLLVIADNADDIETAFSDVFRKMK